MKIRANREGAAAAEAEAGETVTAQQCHIGDIRSMLPPSCFVETPASYCRHMRTGGRTAHGREEERGGLTRYLRMNDRATMT